MFSPFLSYSMVSVDSGAVAQDGRIEPGDMILEVNGFSFENMSNDDAVKTLREAVQKPGWVFCGFTSPTNPQSSIFLTHKAFAVPGVCTCIFDAGNFVRQYCEPNCRCKNLGGNIYSVGGMNIMKVCC